MIIYNYKNKEDYMGEFLDFVSNNYVWFVVGGIILLMAIIGFIAEKTDFGKKPLKEKKVNKKEKEEKAKEPEVVKEPEDNVEKENNSEELDTIDFDIKDNSEDTAKTEKEENVVEDLETTDKISDPVLVNTNTEDLSIPFGDNDNNNIQEDTDEKSTSYEDVKPVEEPSLEDDKLPLPEIDKLDDNDDEDDDVWKF